MNEPTGAITESAQGQTAAGRGNGALRQAAGATVRDAAFDVMRRHGMTTIFGNPGSTEIAFLTDLPPDIRFVLGLHEGSVVGMATGYALARGEPAFVNLHTAAGLGNAINAIANARDCRAPLVILVGQQDRRQIAFEPFLTGRQLDRLAGEYPVWRTFPARGQDVPGAIARAYHEAKAGRGPALLVVPMGDWLEPADELAAGAPARLLRPHSVQAADVSELADLLAGAEAPALVVGAPEEQDWDGVVALAERLRCPVWQEPFSRRVSFPQDHPLFAGHLHWQRRLMHDDLQPYDVVLTLGTNAFRAYLFDEPVALVGPETRVAVLTADAAEAHRSPCDLAVVAPVGATCRALVEQLPERAGNPPEPVRRPAPLAPPGTGEPLRPGHVLDALAERLPDDVLLIEECPSTQPELYQRLPVRIPFGFLSTANGCLGFGLAGSIGLRMGLPDRPVVAVLGDGSTMYAIQALWSAAHYDVGVLLVVLANGRYAVMDGLARRAGGTGAWPGFDAVDIGGLARSLGCPTVRVESHDDLIRVLDEVMPHLASRREPLLVEAVVGE
ncbi:MAG TPA: thiamine pyrophosphate-binding protein [Solirubrobacteraceae bacterium]|nr:thiamine pyrophosphate-binding protein [Solirubrobacteraceae bacterium]